MEDIQIVTSPDEVASLIDPTAMDPTFAQTLAEIEASKKKKEEDAVKLAELAEKSKPKAQPLRLEYKFTGNCECGAEATTLIIENPILTSSTIPSVTVVAFCVKENKQLRTVNSLPRLLNPISIPEPVKLPEVVETAPSIPSGIIPKKGKK